MLFALDLETECAVVGCPGIGGYKKCDHALSPWHNKITVIAVASEQSTKVFHSVDEYRNWYTNRPEQDTYTGHRFAFDLLNLWVHMGPIMGELHPKLEQWVGDSMLACYTSTVKIPDSWLAEYNEAKKKHEGQRDAGKHSLKTTAPYFLGVAPFWETLDHNNDSYVALDASYSLELTGHMESRLKEQGEFSFYKECLLPWAKLLLEAEYEGLHVDLDALTQKEKELSDSRSQLKAELDNKWADAHNAYVEKEYNSLRARYSEMAAKRGVSLNDSARYLELLIKACDKLPTQLSYESPKQMAWLLRDFLGYDIESLEGGESTGKEVLERLAGEGHDDVKTFLEWRKCDKILTAYLPTYKDLIVDGKIHPSYNITGTRTGRTSSERPNVQQVNGYLKPLFNAGPGRSIVGFDFEAIEAKLIALYTEDPVLFGVISDGVSLHDLNATVYFGLDCDVKDVKKLFPSERMAAKKCGFSLFYGAGANRVRIAMTQSGFPLSDLEARNIYNRFKQTYKVAMDYSKQVVQHMEQGNSITNLLGRPIRIEKPEECYLKAFNSLIQSSASDMLLFACNKAVTDLKSNGIDGKIILLVHDYVGVSVPDSEVELATKIIEKALTGFDLHNSLGKIPITVDGGVSKVWEK